MHVAASLLNAYSFCPRAIYLSKVLDLKPQFSEERAKGLISHAVRREISIRQAGMLARICGSSDLESLLASELERIISDVPHIYPGLVSRLDPEKYLPDLRSEILSEILLLGEKLRALSFEMGFDEALESITPWRVEFSLRSDSLSLSGRIDKVMKDPFYVPVEVKTSSVPSGVWGGDRLQTCAYAMLLEDRLGLSDPVGYGFVEYTRVHELRRVLNTEALRRDVLCTRDDVLEILEGVCIPSCLEPDSNKCNSCGYKASCRFI